MNCEEARLLVGSNPHAVPTELAEHLAACAACTRYREEMLLLERDLRRALSLPAPIGGGAPLGSVPHATRRAASRSGWALAASVLLMAGATLVLFALRPADTLAGDVVAHVSHEPESWASASQVQPGALDQVLKRAGVALAADADPVTYAQTCWFRDRYVPHLVVRTAHGPYTVMVLRDTHIPARRYFNEGGYSGLLLPVEGGTLAVLGRGAVSADAAAAEVTRSLHFVPRGSP